jgi:hypothetical protein
MRDFDKRWREMERRGDRIRRVAAAVMLLTWFGFGACIVGGVYLALHPETIGNYAGRIVSGFEEASR